MLFLWKNNKYYILYVTVIESSTVSYLVDFQLLAIQPFLLLVLLLSFFVYSVLLKLDFYQSFFDLYLFRLFLFFAPPVWFEDAKITRHKLVQFYGFYLEQVLQFSSMGFKIFRGFVSPLTTAGMSKFWWPCETVKILKTPPERLSKFFLLVYQFWIIQLLRN